MNYIFLLLFFEIVLFLFAFILNQNDIMAPSVVMCAMFIISTFFAILNIEAWDIKYSLDSCLILSSGLLVYLLAETCFRVFFERSGRTNSMSVRTRIGGGAALENVDTVQNWMVWAVILIDALVLIAYFLRIRSITGLSGFNSMIFSTYRSMTVHLASRTSDDVEQAGALLNQLLKCVRATGFVAEYIILKNMVKKKRFRQYANLLIIIALTVCSGIIVAARGIALQLIAAGFIEYSIIWHQEHGWRRNLSWKVLRIAIIALLCGIPIFHISTQVIGEKTKLDALRYASIYFGGPIQLFDIFVRHPTRPIVFGEETLIGVRQLLEQVGVSVYTRDINLEFQKLTKGMVCNVYTFFRRPLHDFGYGGMLIFTILVALFFSWFYYRKIKWRTPNKRVDCWILIYGFYFYWILISSIDQGSQIFVSFNGISTPLLIVIFYRIMTDVKIGVGNRNVVISRSRRMVRN